MTLAESALQNVNGTRSHFSLQHRHPDGERWLEVGRFATKALADRAKLAFVQSGHGTDDDFRVLLVRIEDR